MVTPVKRWLPDGWRPGRAGDPPNRYAMVRAGPGAWRLPKNPENRISDGAAAPGTRYGKDLRAEAMEQVEKVAARRPIPFFSEGQVVAGGGPHMVSPFFGFGVPQGDELGPVDDLPAHQLACLCVANLQLRLGRPKEGKTNRAWRRPMEIPVRPTGSFLRWKNVAG